jgi:rubrerythrin
MRNMNYTLPEFLAHAIALEKEAAERYLELADMMEAHRNDPVASLFRDMVHYSTLHHDSIVERAQGVALPQLRSWEFRWSLPPEVGGEEAFDYTLDAYNALRYARENEVRAMEYYTDVGLHSSEPEVKRLASEFAAEETEHVAALDEWLARTPRPSATWQSDPDLSSQA